MAATEETRDEVPAKVSHSRYIVTLAAGDALAFLIFAAIGRGSHGEAAGLSAIPQTIVTAAPFAIGWFMVAPFAGAFRHELTLQPRKMALRTMLAWVLSWPVAMALRGIFVDHAVPPISFAIITLLFNTAILLFWRWPYALNNSMRKRI